DQGSRGLAFLPKLACRASVVPVCRGSVAAPPSAPPPGTQRDRVSRALATAPPAPTPRAQPDHHLRPRPRFLAHPQRPGLPPARPPAHPLGVVAFVSRVPAKRRPRPGLSDRTRPGVATAALHPA